MIKYIIYKRTIIIEVKINDLSPNNSGMELRLRAVLLVLLPLLPALYTAPSLQKLATPLAAPRLPSDIWKTCSELS